MKLQLSFTLIFVATLSLPTFHYAMEGMGLKHNDAINNLAALASSTSSASSPNSPSTSSRTTVQTPVQNISKEEMLYDALQHKNTVLAQTLLVAGANSAFLINKETIISVCLKNQLESFLHSLINNDSQKPKLYTVLTYLVKNLHIDPKNYDYIKSVILLGFDVNLHIHNQETLLDSAIGMVKKYNMPLTTELLKFLLNEGADASSYITNSDLDIIKMLVETGNANPTPLFKKTNELSFQDKIDRRAILQYLLHAGASILEFVKQNNTRFVTWCIQNGAQLNHPSNVRLLHAAALRNNHEMVDLLLSNGIDPKLTDPENGNVTALYFVVQYGLNEMVHKLLKAGVPPFAKNSLEEQLMAAVQQNNANKVHALLEQNARPNLTDKNGKHILAYAYDQKNVDIANELIAHECSLIYLVAVDDIATVAWILESCVESTNEQIEIMSLFKKAVKVAKQTEKTAMIELLLRHDLDLDAVVKDEQRPLDCELMELLDKTHVLKPKIAAALLHAIIKKRGTTIYHDVVEFIITYLKKRQQIDMVDNKGNTALYYAIRNGNTEDTISLLNGGASDLIYDRTGHLPIHTIILSDTPEATREKIIEALFACSEMEAGARTKKEGATIIHCAALGDSLKILLRLLKEFNNLINSPDRDGNTPLHYAAQRNTVVCENANSAEKDARQLQQLTGDVIVQLVNVGANLNAQNRNGDTPLMRAVKMNNVEAVKTLLTLGANPQIADKQKQTPLDIASMYKDEELVALLQQKLNPIMCACTSSSSSSIISTSMRAQ